jgi:hypothetical protein
MSHLYSALNMSEYPKLLRFDSDKPDYLCNG